MPEATINENTGITVPYIEIADGNFPRERWTSKGFEADRLFQVAWDDSVQFIADIVGDVVDLGALGGFMVTQGQQYPRFTAARAMSAGVTGYGQNLATVPLTWTHARISVGYAVPDYSLSQAGGDGEQVIVSESLDAAAEFLTLPHQKLWWTYEGGDLSNPIGRDVPIGRLVRLVNWNYTIHHVLRVTDQVVKLVGHVNLAEVKSPTLGLTFEPETLLYNGPRMSQEITVSGFRSRSLEMSYTFRPDGWNKLPRFADNGAFAVFFGADKQEVKPYPPVDFKPLLVNPA